MLRGEDPIPDPRVATRGRRVSMGSFARRSTNPIGRMRPRQGRLNQKGTGLSLSEENRVEIFASLALEPTSVFESERSGLSTTRVSSSA